MLKLLALEALLRNEENAIKTKIGYAYNYYHLSPVGNIQQLEPRTKKNSEKNFTHKSRVCMGDTIHGCIQALFLPGYTRNFSWSPNDPMKHLSKAQVSKKEYIFHVYQIKSSQLKDSEIATYELDDNGHRIFDQVITGELGYYNKVLCTNVGTVKVTMLSEPEHFRNTTHPYLVYYLPTGLSWNKASVSYQNFLDFKVEIDAPVVPTTLTQNLLDSHRELLINRYKIFRDESKRIISKNVQSLISYYDSGIIENLNK